MTRIDNLEWRLRNGFTPPVTWDNTRPVWLEMARRSASPYLPRFPKLGLHLGTHKPTRALSAYYDRATAAPPAAVSRPHPGFAWGMLANDTLGDCVIAMMLHTIEDFFLDAGLTPPAFTAQDAITIYSAITGYNPADPSTDQGTDEGQAMGYWQNPGLAVEMIANLPHVIADTISVNPQDVNEVKIAISEFPDIQFGTALPITAQGQTEWAVVGNPASDPNSEPGSWGGHGIPGREYDADTIKVVSWGAELLETWGFHGAYCQEAHVVLSKEMLNKAGVGPSGVSWDDLIADVKADFQAVQAEQTESSTEKRSRGKKAKATPIEPVQVSAPITMDADGNGWAQVPGPPSAISDVQVGFTFGPEGAVTVTAVDDAPELACINITGGPPSTTDTITYTFTEAAPAGE